MPLYITSLNSGSNGNCYYVGNDTDAVLVDAGISCKDTELRMRQLGLSMSKVRAIIVSHEHADHIRGIPVLAAKFNIPVYITAGTLRGCRFRLDKRLLRLFAQNETFQVGSLEIQTFSKAHDAADPHSFVISSDGVCVGVFTDIGSPCINLERHFKKCHAAFLEANYDEEMLDKGRYPYFLKNRIRGGNGHLSNRQAVTFYRQHKPEHFSTLILSHLSNNNNCPKIVEALFTENALGASIVVASRFTATPVYTINNTPQRVPIFEPVLPVASAPMQMSLF